MEEEEEEDVERQRFRFVRRRGTGRNVGSVSGLFRTVAVTNGSVGEAQLLLMLSLWQLFVEPSFG